VNVITAFYFQEYPSYIKMDLIVSWCPRGRFNMAGSVVRLNLTGFL